MAYIKDIEQEMLETNSLQSLTEIYGEIAAIRMKKIRSSVLANRSFLSSIESIFKDVLASYTARLSERAARGKLKEGTKVTLLSHNGKTVAVLISANTGFYGEVLKEVYRKFIAEIRKNNFEVTIIGKLGRSLFLEEEPNRPYTYFDLPDYGVDSKKLEEAIKHLVPYEEIKIYYGKYQSIVTQTPEVSAISSGTSISGSAGVPRTEFIFEPSVEKILIFFETQIFGSLFEQDLRESQLAKFASRILAMDKASENIKNHLKTLSLQKLRLVHKLENKDQLGLLSSVYHTHKRKTV